jgi:endonuclease YncB( thermonuclease family)
VWEYRAALLDVLDGDTIRALVDLGGHVRAQWDLRLADVTAPELRQPGGVESLEYTRAWMAELASVRWPLLVRTRVNRNPEPEELRSFIRYVADVYDLHSARHLNGELRAFLVLHPEWGPGS